MLKKLCRKPGCPNFRLEGHNYCEKHLELEERKNSFPLHIDNTYKDTFYNSSRWRSISKDYLRRNPLCSQCGAPAEVVHHNYPIGYDYHNAEDFFNEDSFVALCADCHNKLTIKERQQKRLQRKERSNKLWY